MGALPQLAAVNYVAAADYVALFDGLFDDLWTIVALDGAEVVDEASFFSALAAQDIAAASPGNWAALRELLHEKVAWRSEGHVALLWTDAHRMLDGGLATLVEAIALLTAESREMYGSGRQFIACLVGEGPNFPPLRDS